MRFEPGAFNPDHYQLFFSLSLDMFSISADGYFKHINAAWTRVTGYSAQELKARPALDFVHPDDREKTIQCAEAMSQGDEVSTFENRYRCKDGSYRTLRWSAKKHLSENLIFSVTRDVTEEKRQDELLQKVQKEAEAQREKLYDLLMRAPALTAITSGPNHIFEFVNDHYRVLVGGRDVVGLSVREALPGIDDSIMRIMDQVCHGGERYTARDFPIQADWSANGLISQRFFTFIFEPIRESNNQVTGIWVLAIDTTETKILEARLRVSERMASLGTLAAGVAHEVNNPLGYVLGIVGFAEEDVKKLDASELETQKIKLLEKLTSAEEGLERIRRIVRSLKVFSRDQEEKVELIDLHEALKSSAKFAENETRYRAQVILDLQPVPFVLADVGQLGQVFLNLIINAAQAIPTGAVEKNKITISTQTAANGDAILEVRDTGSGIPPEIMGRIFDPFFTSKPVGEGTGLGLSICHGIVSSLNGEISVESKVGQGTVFRIQLPGVGSEMSAKPADAAVVPQEKKHTEISFQGSLILVVDDEPALADVIGLMLESLYQVQVVHNVAEAMEFLKSKEPEVILCDLMMPSQTGMDFYHLLEKSNPKLKDRIIFMTGGVFTPETKEFLSKVSLTTLEKPFPADVLRAHVHSKLIHLKGLTKD